MKDLLRSAWSAVWGNDGFRNGLFKTFWTAWSAVTGLIVVWALDLPWGAAGVAIPAVNALSLVVRQRVAALLDVPLDLV